MNMMINLKSLKETTVNIKGVELALSTVIVIALVLIVMVVLVTFFLGGSKQTLLPLGDAANTSGDKLRDALNW